MIYGNRVPFDGAFPSGDIVIPEYRTGRSIMKSITVDEAPGVRNYPAGAILHFDADADYENEAVGMGHDFNHSILGPQFERQPDGSYSNVGAKPAVDVFDGFRGLRSCGAVTNLVPNSECVGAGVGVPPTGWAASGFERGISFEIIGAGSGYIDIRVFGTATALTSPSLGFMGWNLSPAIVGDKFCAEASCFVLSGDVSGTDFGLMIAEFSSTPAFLTFGATLFSVNERISYIHTVSNASAASVLPYIGMTIQAGQTVDFTVRVKQPQFTKSAYPLPYVPTTASGPVTQPASNATTTNGSWFALPDGSALWNALDGQADGVELITNGGFDSDAGWTFGTGWELDAVNKRARRIGTTYGNLQQNITCEVGKTYVLYQTSGGTITGRLYINGVDVGQIAQNRHVFVATVTNVSLIWGTSAGDMWVDNISVQKLKPATCTVAAEVTMGVGFNDMLQDGSKNIISVRNTNVNILMYQRFSDTGGNIAASNDGTVTRNRDVYVPNVWSRNERHLKVVQTNALGTQFRVGNLRRGIDTAIQWGLWGAFDGSFDPSILYRLMLGYGNAYPMWFNKITAWKEQVSDARILEAMA